MEEVHGNLPEAFEQVRVVLTISLHKVVILIDSRVGVQDSDKLLFNMLTETSRMFVIVLTKADKLKESEL